MTKTLGTNPRVRRNGNLFALDRLFAGLPLVLAHGLLVAQSAIDEDAPWPRVRSTNGNTVTLHLPQVERWTSNSFVARAAIEVKPAEAKKELFGVVWFEAHGRADHSNRIVTLDRFEVTKSRFPDAPDNGSNALAIVRQALPAGARTVSLDYLITALGFIQAAARQGDQGFKHDPPQIIWATNRTHLILIDGEPVLRPVAGTTLERVINTPALLVRDKTESRFYLAGAGQWFAAEAIAGPWSLMQSPPARISALSPTNVPAASVSTELPAPRIIVSTSPAELLMTSGLPDYRPIRGTALSYLADSDSLLFFHNTERRFYLLLSGRWFKSESLRGPWSYLPPHDLPADFARIPPSSPQAIVLASVPDTPQAELASVANSVPTTATVNRRTATIQLEYDGEPKFKPIEGTSLNYAVNAQLPVIRIGEEFYALDNAVWFVARAPTGPWEVATEVPEAIYTIPPSSPVYYATFVRVYDADEDSVETGYTPGYTGTYEDDGTTVYGTGFDYEDWYGEDDYYSWGWTWGYSYYYVPWYQWWVWRPWWGESSGLRAALIENIYDRWQARPGVTPHDRAANGAAISSRAQSFSGFPALYGRFTGSARAAALTPPANTLALNPYSRPQTPARAGAVPRGAQLLSSVRESPGGGRNLYASPDGNVYLRKPDGWYRREGGGNWRLYAPTQGRVERGQVAAQQAAAQDGGAVNRITPGAAAKRGSAQGFNRVPDAGSRLQAQQVAELERQYYARTIAQMRSQNPRAARSVSQPMRGAGRRR